ncbi:MAG: hypothetical protein ACRD29_04085 [Acidimicrobiales bacterium]
MSRLIALAVSSLLVLAACGDGAPDDQAGDDGGTTTTPAVETTTEVSDGTTTTNAAPPPGQGSTEADEIAEQAALDWISAVAERNVDRAFALLGPAPAVDRETLADMVENELADSVALFAAAADRVVTVFTTSTSESSSRHVVTVSGEVDRGGTASFEAYATPVSLVNREPVVHPLLEEPGAIVPENPATDGAALTGEEFVVRLPFGASATVMAVDGIVIDATTEPDASESVVRAPIPDDLGAGGHTLTVLAEFEDYIEAVAVAFTLG